MLLEFRLPFFCSRAISFLHESRQISGFFFCIEMAQISRKARFGDFHIQGGTNDDVVRLAGYAAGLAALEAGQSPEDVAEEAASFSKLYGRALS